MAAAATQNPSLRSESKSAKKKKAKAEVSTESQASAAPAQEASPSNEAESSNGDGAYESPYIKELYKSIRNVNKKITNASKVDNIVAENPGKTLDQLVFERKINKDQQAQILKKPALRASLSQLEEQIAQYKKFDQDYKSKSQAEKAEFEKIHTDRASKELQDAVASTKAEAQATAVNEQSESLLLVSQFLRLAAIRRGEEENAELEESKALEGLLAAVYTGNATAVSAMLNLIKGSSETLKSVDNEDTTVTYADIKSAALSQVPATLDEPVDPVEEEPAVATTEYPIQSDPTIANAGLTELDAPPATAQATTNGQEAYDAQGIPQNSGFGDGAANAAAEANWDNANDLSTSQEWVEVPRNASETETGLTATPAAPSNVQSWADDQPDSPQQATAPSAPPNDGFQEVQKNRGPPRQNNYRGRGGHGGDRGDRGGYRGRGDGRGRGRGGAGRGGRGRPDNA